MNELRLSPEQREAIESDSKAIAVVAGAGSGKTEVVARRIERLLRQSADDEYRVLAVSYTVRAADELRSRLQDRLGDLHRRVDADTTHGFALSLIRQHGTRLGLPREPEIVVRDEDRVEMLYEWLRQAGETRPNDPSALFSKIDLARARCRNTRYLEEWRNALESNGALDYPAMLERAWELTNDSWLTRYLRRIYEHVIVDEAQNMTRAQYSLLCNIIGNPSADHCSAMLVGDERQSIVGFAGADSRLISEFAISYEARRIELVTNYRSAQKIVEAGQKVARELGQPADLTSGEEFGASGSVNVENYPTEEAEGSGVAQWVVKLLSTGLDPSIMASGESTVVTPESIAVVGRTAASLRATKEELLERGVEVALASKEDDWVATGAANVLVEVVGYLGAPHHASVKRRIGRICEVEDGVDDVPEMLRASSDRDVSQLVDVLDSNNPNELIERVKNLNVCDTDFWVDFGLLEDTLISFVESVDQSDQTFGNFRQYISRCQRGDSLASGVRLLTIHKAQGREFKALAVVACNDGQLPDFRADSRDAQIAEMRTFYVAVTRPSRALLLTRSNTRSTRFGLRETERSRFLNIVE